MNIIIQKSEKGNSRVAVYRDQYIKKMEYYLSDENKNQKVAVKSVHFLILISVRKNLPINL